MEANSINKGFDSPSHENFLKLFNELIETYSKSSLSNLNRNKLRNDLFHIIFTYRNEEKSPHSLSELEKVLWYSHILQRNRKFDDVQKLNNLFKKMLNDGVLQNQDFMNVVIFLTNLIDCDPKEPQNSVCTPAPWISSTVKEINNLPHQPLCYNDTRHDSAFSRWHYTHFPAHLFDISENSFKVQSNSLKWSIDNFFSCDKEPGLDHQFNFLRKDDNDAALSCFGALTGPKLIKSPLTPDTPLSIPSLPHIPEWYSFVHSLSYRKGTDLNLKSHYSQTNEYDGLTVDEGYVSSQCSETGNSVTKKEDDLWEQVLKDGFPPQRLSWEKVQNSGEVSSQKPFITEAGNQVTQRIRSLEQHFESTIDPSSYFESYYEISPSQLCHEILRMLIGVPTSNFSLQKNSSQFEMRENLSCQGISSETLMPYLQDLIHCGNKVLSLEEFCSTLNKEVSSEDPKNLSVKCFKEGIKNFLYYYRQKMALLEGETKILSLKMRSEPLRRKICYVFKICFQKLSQEHLSNSLSLIGVLCNEFLTTRSSSNLYLLLSFLNCACKPFLVFLEKWIYEGDYCDPGSEFMIETDEEALQSDSRSYWTRAFTLTQSFREFVPEFMRDVLSAAFLCGKSMKLLRVCCPRSFLLDGSRKYPEISICSSLNQVLSKRIQCHKYLSDMTRLSSSCVLTLEELDRRKIEKEEKMCKIAMETRLQHLRNFQKKKEEEKLRETKMKHERFQLLQEDLKMASLWKEKMRDEAAKEEEKLLLKARIREEEQTLFDVKERAKMLSNYEEEMESLKAMESSLHTELGELKLKMNLNLRISNPHKVEKDPTLAKDVPDPDSESISQMSTDSDVLDTPNDPISAVSPQCIQKKLIDNENSRMSICEQNGLSQNVFPTYIEEDAANANIQSVLDTTDAQNEVDTFVADALNLNNNNNPNSLLSEASMDRTTNILARPLVERSDTSACISKFLNENPSLKTRGFEESLEAAEDTSQDNNTDANKLQAPVKIEDNPASGGVAIPELDENGAATENDEKTDEEVKVSDEKDALPSGDLFRMRKSKSESLSLKDSHCSMLKRNPDRFSLYDMHGECAPVLIDEVGGEKLKRRGRSTYGHASDSVIQNILWGKAKEDSCEEKSTPPSEDVSLLNAELRRSVSESFSSRISPYTKDFPYGGKVHTDVTFRFLRQRTSFPGSSTDREEDDCGDDIASSSSNHLSFAPLYIVRGFKEHTQVQSKLVNAALLSHFLVDRDLMGHLLALREFVLLHDASFAHSVTQSLIHKFARRQGRRPSSTRPVELNGILNEAVAASPSSKSPFAKHLSFVVTNTSTNDFCSPLDLIELRYSVKWPLTIILDDKVLSSYYSISKFLSRLHQVMWTVEDTFTYMSTLRSRNYEMSKSAHFHQLSVFRHVMQQFVRVFYGYVAHQAIETSWRCFERVLRESVTSVDELYEAHASYLRDVDEKCFYPTVSSPLQTLIRDLFSEVNLFNSLLKASRWTDQFENCSFAALQQRKNKFVELSFKFNKTLELLAQVSSSIHVEDLILQLNFNEPFTNA